MLLLLIHVSFNSNEAYGEEEQDSIFLQQLQVLQKDLKKAVYLFFNEIAEALSNNSRCELRHFGTFKIKNMKARIGRNPKTGTQVMIEKKKIPSFKTVNNMIYFEAG